MEPVGPARVFFPSITSLSAGSLPIGGMAYRPRLRRCLRSCCCLKAINPKDLMGVLVGRLPATQKCEKRFLPNKSWPLILRLCLQPKPTMRIFRFLSLFIPKELQENRPRSHNASFFLLDPSPRKIRIVSEFKVRVWRKSLFVPEPSFHPQVGDHLVLCADSKRPAREVPCCY